MPALLVPRLGSKDLGFCVQATGEWRQGGIVHFLVCFPCWRAGMVSFSLLYLEYVEQWVTSIVGV